MFCYLLDSEKNIYTAQRQKFMDSTCIFLCSPPHPIHLYVFAFLHILWDFRVLSIAVALFTGADFVYEIKLALGPSTRPVCAPVSVTHINWPHVPSPQCVGGPWGSRLPACPPGANSEPVLLDGVLQERRPSWSKYTRSRGLLSC